jgi:hypothetical protein
MLTSSPECSVRLAALEPGAEMNKNLRRVYAIVPSIGAWARSNMQSPLWASEQEAFMALLDYVGPAIDQRIAESLHYSKEDIEFLGTSEVFNAITWVVREIYSGRSRLVNGLFPEQEAPSAQP